MKNELVKTPPFSRNVLLLLLAITLFGAAARWLPVRDPLWLDELHTSWVISGKLSEVAPRAAMGNQSPLYFYGVWAVTRLFGQSEVTLRLLSLIAGILLIPAVFILGTRWTGSPIAGLVAAALVAVEREFLFYSTEARPYALALLVGVIQVAFFTRSCGFSKPSDEDTASRWRDGLVLILSSVVLFYLHYTTALLFVAEGIVLAEMSLDWALLPRGSSSRVRKPVLNVTLNFVIVAVCCLPAIPALIAIGQRRQQWDGVPTVLPADYIWRVLVVYVALPGALVGVAALLRSLRNHCPITNRLDLRTFVLTLSWLVMPGYIVLCADRPSWANLVHLRYIIVSAVAPMVLAGLLCGLAFGRRTQSLIAVAVITAGLLASPWLASLMRGDRAIPDRNENWRAMSEMINASEASKEEPVFVCSNLVEDGLLASSVDPMLQEYCLFAVSGVHAIDRRSRQIHAIPTHHYPHLASDHVQQVATAGGAWLIVRGFGADADAIEADVVGTLRRSGLPARRRSRHAFGFLTAIWIGID